MANREIVDHYLSEGQREFEALRRQARRNNPFLYAKLKRAEALMRQVHEAAIPGGRLKRSAELEALPVDVAYIIKQGRGWSQDSCIPLPQS